MDSRSDRDIPDDPTREDLLRVFSADAIESMVGSFYARVRSDSVLGPVFTRRIEDWPPHLERLVDFWRGVLRGEGTFKPSVRGTPHKLHRQIEELELRHFERWLSLFEETARSTFPPNAAQLVTLRARQIGMALSAHLPTAADRSHAKDGQNDEI